MSGRDDSDSDSDAPEEFTSQQGILVDEEIRKIQKENKTRVIREGKERRRQWTQRLTPREPKRDKHKDANEVAPNEESGSQDTAGMLPSNIVQLIAAGEKRVFSSDSEDEKPVVKPRHRKKKSKSSRIETVILNDMPPPKCLQSSLDFLKKKKMQVPRSSSVLNNPNQALRLISSSGLLNKN